MKYHLVGIGGVSMSGVAQLLISQGNEVSGCDLKKAKGKTKKEKVWEGHDPKHITKDLDAVVVTAAATHKGSPAEKEIEQARALSIRVISRSKLIGQLMSRSPETLCVRGSGSRAQKASGNDKIGIAITGMHGKTTTTTMIGEILEAAGYDPTVLVGSSVKKWKGNVRIKNSKFKNQNDNLKLKIKNLKFGKITDFFVVEACEYERQMLDFRPKIAVILNLEEEHLDTYPGGMKDIRQAFKKFIKILPPNGFLVVNQDDKNLMPLTKAAKCKVKRFGKAKIWPGLNLKIPGKHNLLNASAAARVCHELGVSHEIIKNTLNNFIGADRRFELKGEKNGITVIDDYGHHPTEIRATIQAAREKMRDLRFEFEKNKKLKTPTQNSNPRLITVFQPHQYTRTKLLFNDFVKSFSGVDKLIISDIYLITGREPAEARADFSRDLVEAIKAQGVDAEYLSTYDKIVKELQKIAKPGDVVLTIGATEIYRVGEQFLMSNS